jgi:site-specific recombinase XerD
MASETAPVVLVPGNPALPWIQEYQQTRLTSHLSGTIAVYTSILHHFTQWIVDQTRKRHSFHPEQITPPTITLYLSDLAAQGYSLSHRKRVLSVLTHFCQWLVDAKHALPHNPTRGMKVASSTDSQGLPPHPLTPTQRVILQTVVKKDDERGQALFALGYWAGCRVKDITHLLLEHTHIGPQSGWLLLGGREANARSIDLPNEARRALYVYLQTRKRDEPSPYVFPSQRGDRLTEAGLHHWFRTLKAHVSSSERAWIDPIRFHDLRDDFILRALSAGWTLEEIAYYVGNVTNLGTLAVQTPVRYTQVTRAQIKGKLKLFKG